MKNASLIHPGTVMGSSHYANISKHVAAIKKMKDESAAWPGCRCIANVNIGPFGVGLGHKEFTGDCTQSYKFVLLWLATGDNAYALKAAEIIRSWSVGCHSFGGANAPLEIGWGCILVRSAEILRYKWSGWKESGLEKSLGVFIDKIMLPNLTGRYKEIIKWNNNWILTILEALMQIYIYKDDIEKFKWCIDEYKNIRPRMFLGETGKNNEIERDIIHASFQLLSHINICEMAYHQGIVLYDQLIWKSCEYIASIINGKVPADMTKEKIKDPWYMPACWEIAINHYVRRMKMPMPESESMMQQKKRRPEGATFCWGCGWTHALVT